MKEIIDSLNVISDLTEQLKIDINNFDKNKDRISRNHLIVNTGVLVDLLGNTELKIYNFIRGKDE